MTSPMIWIGFNLFVFAMLALDLGVFNRKTHVISVKEALIWTVVWIALALAFNVGIYHFRGHEDAMSFLTGYLLEKSLSVDNLFVFLLIFSYFRVPGEYQHKILFWGILGALIMRALFIFMGTALISRFHWIIYLLGLFLIYTGIKLAFSHDEEIHPEANPILKLFRRFMPVTSTYEGDRFFVIRDGKRMATPMLVVLLIVETTDVMFAVDSIPAIFAVTLDPFLVYTSNVFAILGLRSLYFALAGVMRMFEYLNYGLALILSFIGMKMLLSETEYKIPTNSALIFVGSVLLITVVASIIKNRFFPNREEEAPAELKNGPEAPSSQDT